MHAFMFFTIPWSPIIAFLSTPVKNLRRRRQKNWGSEVTRRTRQAWFAV